MYNVHKKFGHSGRRGPPGIARTRHGCVRVAAAIRQQGDSTDDKHRRILFPLQGTEVWP